MKFEKIIHLTTINVSSDKIKWRTEHELNELETTTPNLNSLGSSNHQNYSICHCYLGT